MAAGGIFEEVSDKPHELEMIEFGIACVQWVRRFQPNFRIRMGIHVGGPIIAGILGRDKPFFDVYGDSVNTAARLESSCPVDAIQVSQNVRPSIPDGCYHLEERPNVFLKGKGYQPTYIVHVPDIL